MPIMLTIHRRVNAPVEFRGLKAQYILYAGAVVIGALFLFVILYIAGVSSWVCLPLCFAIGILGIAGAYHCSHRYGIHGWRKRRIARQLPKGLKATSRNIYLQLKN